MPKQKQAKAIKNIRSHSHRDHVLVLMLCAIVLAILSTVLYFHETKTKKVDSTPAVTVIKKQDDQVPKTKKKVRFEIRQKILRDYTIPPVINGLAPVLSSIPTKRPVVFLGIDDGANKQPFELEMVKANNIKASLYLANRFISNDYDYFKDYITAGSLIEDHSMTHTLLAGKSYGFQKQEICDTAELFLSKYGRRPIFFRPPGGSYDVTTQRAAADCGMKAVVLWIAKANGGSMQYQIGNKLRPGDIVLMHFRPEFKADMQAFLNAQNAAGLHTELLEDWL
ncbi:MAG: polysaccharide deacetylase family protein [Candidatus Saccharibacteria bacterium]|nr:polysaccharide deacetylase family protein [Candidatus Saccharibacteria bacterium]